MTATINLVGNLVRDAELAFTQSGAARLTFTVAVNAPKPRDGQPEEPPSFWDVTLWRDDAVTYSERLAKGVRVSVTGRARIREYERSDGTKGRSAEVVFPIVGIVPPREKSVSATSGDDPWAAPAQTPASSEPPF